MLLANAQGAGPSALARALKRIERDLAEVERSAGSDGCCEARLTHLSRHGASAPRLQLWVRGSPCFSHFVPRFAPPRQVSVARPDPEQPLVLHANLKGPWPDAPVLHFVLKIPETYPADPPAIQPCTNFFGHPNFFTGNDGGQWICCDMLRHDYSGTPYKVRAPLLLLATLPRRRDCWRRRRLYCSCAIPDPPPCVVGHAPTTVLRPVLPEG